MNEADFRQGAYRMLRKMGYWPLRGRDATICPRCHTSILPPIGRPDIIILAPQGFGRVLETKFVSNRETSFPFSSISEEQRKWLCAWKDAGGLGYLGIGVQTRPASFYIIDWGTWLAIEEMVSPVQASLPVSFDNGKGYSLILRQKGYDLVTLCGEYKLTRAGGEWQVPDTHSLLKWRYMDGQ